MKRGRAWEKKVEHTLLWSSSPTSPAEASVMAWWSLRERMEQISNYRAFSSPVTRGHRGALSHHSLNTPSLPPFPVVHKALVCVFPGNSWTGPTFISTGQVTALVTRTGVHRASLVVSYYSPGRWSSGEWVEKPPWFSACPSDCSWSHLRRSEQAFQKWSMRKCSRKY